MSTTQAAYGPVGAWFKLLQSTNGGHLALLSTYVFAAFVRWATALNGYSGARVPPMFGDFEAQRHWMEITTALPRKEWYRYDLKYWGLDYPLLTAYHSWFMGQLGRMINPAWMSLDTSRGLESEGLKTFMRLTALATDWIIYVPAVVIFANRWVGHGAWVKKNVLILLILLQPGLIIIDHGHFQYNSAMLGFTLWAVVALFTGHHVLASVFFVLALNFKQMALFYAIPVFAFLLGTCCQSRKGLTLFVKLATTVIFTFTVIFVAYSTDLSDILQVVRRVFPVERGLYEDKVANVWCALSVLVKLRQMFEMQSLVHLSLSATLLAALPSSLHVFRNPRPLPLLYALLNASLAFFLFAFQVHEKSILLPALPATLLILDDTFMAAFFNSVALYSMLPLLIKDDLLLPYVLLGALWLAVTAFSWSHASTLLKFLASASYTVIAALHILQATVPPPARYPDLYTMANVLVCTGLFVLLLLYFNYRQLQSSTLTMPVASLKIKKR
ncbi:Glucosyltransferase-like protein [Geranomyces michiganensis]|nr:Glucosyltransferase-like protein [Geranomyces michiganensis]